jgi:hypothetical protein
MLELVRIIPTDMNDVNGSGKDDIHLLEQY